MAGKIDKGFISKIMGDPDWYGHPTKAQINPCTNSGAVTPAITIPWYLRGKTGNLKVGDEVAYALFDDGTGVIIDRLDGEWDGHFDYDTTTTGDVVNEKTMTTHGDVTNKSNENTEGNVKTQGTTTSIGQITGQGGMAISGGNGGASATITGDIKLDGTMNATGDVTAGGISLKNHTHQGVHGQTGSAQ